MTDVFADADSIKRRRALMDALLQQSQTSPIVGNTGLGQALAKLGTAWVVGKKQRGLDEQSSANRGQYQQELSGELDRFMTRREGAPGEVMNDSQVAALMQNNVAPQLRDPVAADPKGAMFAAMASRFPEMQSVGQAGLREALAGNRRTGNVNTIKEVNGKLVDIADPANPRVIGDFSKPADKYSEPYMMDGPSGQKILVRKNESTGKVESVVGSGQQINVNTGDVAGIKGLVEANLPGGKGYEAAKGAAQSLMLANEQVAAINQGAKTGSLGNVQQELRKFGELLGVPNAATAPTEMVGNLAKQRVLAKLGGLGAQISNSDRDFLSQAQGDLTTNPEAFKRLLALSIAVDLKELQRHGKRVTALDGKIDPAMQEAMKMDFRVEMNPEVDAMVQRILSGKASVEGVPGASSANPAGPRRPAAPSTSSTW
jgi:hypothetical protein